MSNRLGLEISLNGYGVNDAISKRHAYLRAACSQLPEINSQEREFLRKGVSLTAILASNKIEMQQ